LDIAAVVTQIPNLILYVVPGYLFISFYSFTTFNKQEFKNKIISSIGFSFILKILFDLLNGFLVGLFGVHLGTSAYFLGFFACCLCVAYLCAKLTETTFFKSLISKLGIKRSINKNIWADTINPGDYLELYLENPDMRYFGQVDKVEEDTESPWIVLSKYSIVKADNMKIDHADNPKLLAMLNVKKITRVKIVRQAIAKNENWLLRTSRILKKSRVLHHKK